jgi:transcriptional regulator with XRE-family HTH domain
MPDLEQVFASNVRAERGRLGWTQRELAHQVNLSVGLISDVERGYRSLRLPEVAIFCRAFGVQLTRMLHGAEPEDLEALGLRRARQIARHPARPSTAGHPLAEPPNAHSPSQDAPDLPARWNVHAMDEFPRQRRQPPHRRRPLR